MKKALGAEQSRQPNLAALNEKWDELVKTEESQSN